MATVETWFLNILEQHECNCVNPPVAQPAIFIEHLMILILEYFHEIIRMSTSNWILLVQPANQPNTWSCAMDTESEDGATGTVPDQFMMEGMLCAWV